MRLGRAAAVAAALLLAAPAAADEHSHVYAHGEDVVVWFNTVGPAANNQETYEFNQMPFCLGSKLVTHHHETLGEALLGIELVNSGIDVRFNVSLPVTRLCTKTLQESEIGLFVYGILNNYVYTGYIDDLLIKGPIGIYDISQQGAGHYGALIYTHREITLGINSNQIVFASVNSSNPIALPRSSKSIDLDFTYSVNWVPSNIQFKDRFDSYLESNFFEHRIHWFSIFNSFMMVIFLVGVVVVILMRTLKRDFARYENEEGLLDMDRDLGDEYGWKLVHGDVFRAPQRLAVFCAAVGTGIQLCFMVLLVILVTIMGNLYTERASMLTASIFIYALTSTIAGYYSGSLFTKYNGKRWINTMLLTSALWPGTISAATFFINFVAVYYGTSRAIPFTTMIAVVSIWLFIVFPLTLIGAVIGRNWGSTPHFPCRVNPIPRPIPDKSWYSEPTFIIAISGILPFGAVFIELYFVFTSFWEYKIYYVYGFMLLVYTILVIVTACVSIVATYVLLNAEDHRWHWTIFFASGSTAGYIFLYSIYYFHSVTKMYGVFQTVWYFGYTAVACFTLFCMLGSIGAVTAHRFVRSIYSNVKVD